MHEKTLNSNTRFLSDESPDDRSWDTLKTSSGRFADFYAKSALEVQQKRGQRCDSCSEVLMFGLHPEPEKHIMKHKLKAALFCRVRLCPVCMQRKSLRWKARFHQAWPAIKEQYPTSRYIHLVLTVRNCPVTELRETIRVMNEAWRRLISRKTFPGTGFVKSLEVTREMDFCATCKGDRKKRHQCRDREHHTYNQNCHPHLHVLLQVPAGYFKSGNYFNQEKWAQIWQESLRADYKPVVWVETVKTKKDNRSKNEHKFVPAEDRIADAVKEVVKYTVKPDEVLEYAEKDGGVEWFLELDRQLDKTRSVSLGGSFKELMSEEEPTEDEMIQPGDEDEELTAAVEYREYIFHRPKTRYALLRILSPEEYEPDKNPKIEN